MAERTDELEGARAEADRANAAKSSFLSRVSHELRTPLNAILGFGQLLELDRLTAEQEESVGQILAAGRQLLGLIEDVLDISRIEAGELALSLAPLRIGDVLPEALDLLQPIAVARRVRLARAPTGATAGHVVADRRRLRQVVLNMLSNAVKYNRDGGSVEVSCTEQRGRTLCIDVRDTGPGIGPGRPRAPLRPLRAPDDGGRGHGARPLARPAAGRGDGRPHHRGIDPRRGQHLLGRARPRPSRRGRADGRSQAGARPDGGRARRPLRRGRPTEPRARRARPRPPARDEAAHGHARRARTRAGAARAA